VSNLEGHRFNPMLLHFFYQLCAPDGVVGPHDGRWGWSGPREKFECKLKHEFEFRQDMK
jgi:hypothetical protein